jgi:hypothetical protein
MEVQDPVRRQIVELLRGGHAHADFERATVGFAPALRGKKVRGLPYSAWQLLEHMRIAQADILGFSRSASHVSPPWPRGYWPAKAAPPSAAAWSKAIKAFRADLKAMEYLIGDPASDLHTPFPWGDGQTLYREALLVADHNAYHLGELVLLRRLLGNGKG